MMERVADPARMQQHLRLVRLVVGAVAASCCLLALVIYLLAHSGQLRALSTDADKIQLVFAPLAVALLAVAPAMKRAIFKRAESAGFGGDVERWLAAHRTAVIVAAALREGSAILGLLMSLLSGQPRWSYLFSALAVVALLVDWPKPGELEE
jgi:hypothetical protein